MAEAPRYIRLENLPRNEQKWMEEVILTRAVLEKCTLPRWVEALGKLLWGGEGTKGTTWASAFVTEKLLPKEDALAN